MKEGGGTEGNVSYLSVASVILRNEVTKNLI